jgi:adenylate cyclase class 2
MPIEIEKKFRLTKTQREEILRRLPEIGAVHKGLRFEVNTIYSGQSLEVGQSILRLRRIDSRGILTFKKRLPSRSAIKQQLENETPVGDPEAMALILESMGFSPALVYEKRRDNWLLGKTKIVIDELPFGWFMEIEGSEESIREIESKLAIKRLRAEFATYPQLTMKHGKKRDGVVEARFEE